MLVLHKLFYRCYRLATGVEHWFRRRFTKAGIALGAGLIVSMLLGSDVTQTMAFQVFALLAALLITAMLMSVRFRGRFAVERSLPRLGTAGVPFRYRVIVHNLTARVQNGLELMEEAADPRPTQAEFIAAEIAESRHMRGLRLVRKARQRSRRLVAHIAPRPISPLSPEGEAEVTMEILPIRRGVLRLDGMSVARRDPFGLFRSFVRVPVPQSVLILPARHPLPHFAMPGVLQYQRGGVALAGSVGQSEEFVSLRDYRHGDPLRHVHWRSWAKAGRAIVKEFQDEFFVRHALVLDTFADLSRAGLFEEAVSVAASFACSVLTQESLLDLMFVGPQAYCFTAGRGVAHVDQMLEVLAAVQLCPDQAFGTLSSLVTEHAGTLSGCIFVLLAWDEARRKCVQRLRAMGMPVLVLVLTDDRSRAEDRESGPLEDAPGCFHAIESDRVAQSLARL